MGTCPSKPGQLDGVGIGPIVPANQGVNAKKNNSASKRNTGPLNGVGIGPIVPANQGVNAKKNNSASKRNTGPLNGVGIGPVIQANKGVNAKKNNSIEKKRQRANELINLDMNTIKKSNEVGKIMDEYIPLINELIDNGNSQEIAKKLKEKLHDNLKILVEETKKEMADFDERLKKLINESIITKKPITLEQLVALGKSPAPQPAPKPEPSAPFLPNMNEDPTTEKSVNARRNASIPSPVIAPPPVPPPRGGAAKTRKLKKNRKSRRRQINKRKH